jgi:hypothetical protein
MMMMMTTTTMTAMMTLSSRAQALTLSDVDMGKEVRFKHGAGHGQLLKVFMPIFQSI